MTRKTTPKNGDYEVGYGRPPKAHQFQKHTSGNPKGRPKGARSIGSYLAEAMAKKVTVTENGKSRKTSSFQGMIHRLFNDGLRGNNASAKILLLLIEKHVNTPESKVSLVDLFSEDAAILDQARREGLLPPLEVDETPDPENGAKPALDQEDEDGRPV